MTAAQENEIRPPAHDELQPGAVGRLLCEAREGYRQDLATVSQQLRIRSVYLKAIEEGHYQDLPGSTYAVGFVRSYAEYLGLDPNEIVRRFRDEAAEVNRRTKLVFPMPAVEARVPSGALVLIALTVAVFAYGGWYYLSDRDRSLVDLVPSVPESLQSLVDPDNGTDSDTTETAPAVSVATADAASVVPSEDTETDAPATDTSTSPTTTSTASTVETGSTVTTTADGAATTTIVESAATSSSTTLDVDNPDANQVDDTAAVTELGGGASAVTTMEPATTDVATADAVSAATVAETSETATSSTTATQDAATNAVTAADTGENTNADVNTNGATAAGAQTAAAEPGADVVDPTTQQIAVIPEAPRVPDSVQDSQDFGVAFGGSRVVIVARMESFLRVRDAAGNEIWSRLLRSGDRYLVPERDGLTLTVGNAGGVDVFVDGRKAPALGAVGVGVTGISLDPERLAAGTALP